MNAKFSTNQTSKFNKIILKKDYVIKLFDNMLQKKHTERNFFNKAVLVGASGGPMNIFFSNIKKIEKLFIIKKASM